MGSFYKFQTASSGSKLIFINTVSRVDGRPLERVPASEYLWKFEEIESSINEFGVKEFRAPEVVSEWIGNNYMIKLKKGAQLPDFFSAASYTIVSEKVKTIVESFDSYPHQFERSNYLDSKGVVLNSGPFYSMNVRRVFEFFGDENCEKPSLNYSLKQREKKMLSSIQQNPTLHAELNQIPLWKIKKQPNLLYMSEAFLNALRSSDVTGIASYSKGRAQSGQGVVRCA